MWACKATKMGYVWQVVSVFGTGNICFLVVYCSEYTMVSQETEISTGSGPWDRGSNLLLYLVIVLILPQGTRVGRF